MSQVPLEDVKRMIDIENILIEIQNNNVEITNFNSIEILNIVIDKLGDLNAKDMEYVDIAIKLPFREIKMYYDAYKSKKDKIKESQFIEYLMKTYNIDKFFIIKRLDQINRIRNVERLNLYHKVNLESKNKKTKGGK